MIETYKKVVSSLKLHLTRENQKLLVEMSSKKGLINACLNAINELNPIFNWETVDIVCDKTETLNLIKEAGNIFGLNSNIELKRLNLNESNINIIDEYEDYQVIVLLDLHPNHKVYNHLFNNYNGTLLLFTNRISVIKLQEYKNKGLIVAHKSSL